jgi:hypothetical protein
MKVKSVYAYAMQSYGLTCNPLMQVNSLPLSCFIRCVVPGSPLVCASCYITYSYPFRFHPRASSKLPFSFSGVLHSLLSYSLAFCHALSVFGWIRHVVRCACGLLLSVWCGCYINPMKHCRNPGSWSSEDAMWNWNWRLHPLICLESINRLIQIFAFSLTSITIYSLFVPLVFIRNLI